MVGIGINPPVSTVEAYHQHKDGHSADVLCDLDEPRRLHELISDGILTWSEALSRASFDTCRNNILSDLAAPSKRSIRSFMDDTRVASGFSQRALVMLQGQKVHYCNEASSTGHLS